MAISADSRFTTGLIAGLVLLGGVAVVECAHTLWVLDDLLPGSGNRISFVVATLGPTLFGALVIGVVLGLGLAVVHLLARGLSRRSPADGAGLLRIARVESFLLAAMLVAALAAVYPAFAPQLRRIANAAIVLSRPFIPGLSEVFVERAPPTWAVALVALLPAAAVGWCWFAATRADLAEGTRATPPSRIRAAVRGLFSLAALAAGLALHHATATLYVNQYRDLHITGLLGVGVCFVAAGWLLPSRTRSRIRRFFSAGRVRTVMILGVAALLAGSHVVLERKLVVEAAVLWRTNAARKTVAVLRSVFDRDRDGFACAFGGDDADDANPEIGAWWQLRGSEPSNPDDGKSATLPTIGFTRPEALDHVALVSIDALRTDVVGFFGASPSATPGLDRLAARGVRFRRAYAPGALTSVTYPAILRARHPFVAPRGTRAPITTFPQALGERGIFTAGIFCAFFADPGGFSHTDLSIHPATPKPSETSVRLVRKILDRSDPRSALWVHFIDPHAPYVDRSPDGRGGDARALQLSEVTAADAAASTLVDEILSRFGPRTAVLLFADHGEEFGEHGSKYHGITAYEELIHVPLVLIAPGLEPRDVEKPVSLVHVGATVLDLLHVPPPPSFHGRSLLRLAGTGVDPSFDSSVVAVNNDDMVAWIEPSGRWKLLFEKRLGFVELYDLVADPRERTNLADARPDVLRNLQDAFVRWSSGLARRP